MSNDKMKASVLVLTNNAPNYYHFFNHTACLLKQDGADVCFAVDSTFSRDITNIDSLGFPIYDFSAFFKEHEIDHSILKKYYPYNLNSTLLSDFERAQVYGVWGKKDKDYFDKLKSALLSFFEKIISERNVKYVLYENVSNTFSYLAWIVCQQNNLKYIGVGGSRLPGRFSITSDPLNDNAAADIFEQINSGSIEISEEVLAWCDDYLNNIEHIVPDYMKINGLDNTGLFAKYFKTETLKKLRKTAKYIFDDPYYAFQTGNPFFTYLGLFKRNLYRKVKLQFLKNYYDNVVEGERYLLYPMHFHPESSTSILSGSYLDEYEVIRNIAFNLPEGVKLYVKDHISAWGYPSIEFYHKLQKLPNVRVLHPNAPTKVLIKNSLAVITLTSTVGYEALLLGKKVFLFGRVFYEFHKNVVKISSPTELFNLFLTHLDNNTITEREYSLRFLASYYLSTYQGSLNLMLKDELAKEKANELYVNIFHAKNTGN